MIGLTNSVNVAGSSGGGDVIYAANDSSGTIAAGDKVWLNFRSLDETAKQVTDRISNNAYYYYYPMGREMYVAGQPGVARCVYDETSQSWTELVLNSNIIGMNFVQTFNDNTVALRNFGFIRKNTTPVVIANGEVNPSMNGIYLGDDLSIYSTATENILTLQEYNPLTGVLGEIYYTFPNNGYIYGAWLNGSYLITMQERSNPTFRFYDVTDKTSPVLLNTQNLTGDLELRTATGTSVGDYLFGVSNWGASDYYGVGGLRIYQINETPSLVDPVGLPEDLENLIGQNASVIYDIRTKILTVGTHDSIYAWKFNETNKTFSRLNVDIDVTEFTNIHADGVFILSLTDDLTTAALGYRRSSSNLVYPTTVLYKFIEGSGWTIVDESAVNSLTITGFATGETDAEGKYEINTVLPDEVMITVNVTPDPDSFTFTGEAQ